MPVIKHFIEGVEETGDYVGFCSMGLSCQPTENAQLREHFQMRPGLTGVLVSRINPISDAYRVLKKDDIILSFDGVLIANDGSGSFQLIPLPLWFLCGVKKYMKSDYLSDLLPIVFVVPE